MGALTMRMKARRRVGIMAGVQAGERPSDLVAGVPGGEVVLGTAAGGDSGDST